MDVTTAILAAITRETIESYRNEIVYDTELCVINEVVI